KCDYFYPISVLEREEILKTCRVIGIHGITTIATDISVPTICYVANQLGLVSNSLYSSIITTNKFTMREALSRAKLRIPKFLEYGGADNYHDLVLDRLRFPVIVKPVDRSGSLGVTKVDAPEDLFAATHIAI